MKGMLDFLEKAGLVKMDAPSGPVAPEMDITLSEPSPVVATAPAVPAAPITEPATPLNLDDIYTAHGVGPSLYPAERLLRLVDGLSAMDVATRLMAIQAMDAADESWTIDDPLADAAAKVNALQAHARSRPASVRLRRAAARPAAAPCRTRTHFSRGQKATSSAGW